MKRSCEACGGEYEAIRNTARYCGERCRKRGQRGHRVKPPRRAAEQPVSASPSPSPSEVEVGGVAVVVRETLAAVNRDGTYLGALAVSLAARIDESTAAMGLAPLAQQLRSTMDAALEGTGQVADALDELRARRDRKRAG